MGNVDFQRKRLLELYKADESARALLDYFASRERNWSKTTVDRIQQNVASEGIAITRSQVVDVLKRLAEIGCGRFIAGRRGHPSRFEWSVGLASVGKLAAGEEVEVEEPERDKEGDDDGIARMMTHRYQLRPQMELELFLPTDLTTTEATRLADFIKTLPFN